MKKIASLILFASLIFTLTACGSSTTSNKDIQVDASAFSSLNYEQDKYSGVSFYYPDVAGRHIIKGDFSRSGSTDTFFYISPDYNTRQELTALPVVRYDPNADTPYQLECVLQYHYTFWDSHRCFPFENAVIVTDNHRYSISQITCTENLEVMGASNIIILGKTGIDMIKDICSCSSISVQMTGVFDSKEITVSSSVFKSVLDIIKLYEAAGCGEYNFTAVDTNITVS